MGYMYLDGNNAPIGEWTKLNLEQDRLSRRMDDLGHRVDEQRLDRQFDQLILFEHKAEMDQRVEMTLAYSQAWAGEVKKVLRYLGIEGETEI